MKITLESTPELAHANGLPVRIWTGATEGGTPILALITRIAAPDTASPEELAKLERELSEAPTRVVDPSGERIDAPRTCTICNAVGQTGKRATFIAGSADGMQWFECDGHGVRDHDATFETGLPRTSLESLEAWFARHDLPVPGGAPGVSRPDYFGQCVLADAGLSERIETAAGLLCLEDPLHLVSALFDAGLRVEGTPNLEPDAAEPLRQALDRVAHAKVAELVSECRSLRERLKDAERGPGWLVKDFHALYSAALDVSESIVDPDRISPPVRLLRAQLDRLRPAYESIEAERRASHAARRARFEALAMEAEKTPTQDLIHQLGRVVALDAEAPEAAHRCMAPPTPRLPQAITAAILNDREHVDNADTRVAATFIVYAMRGASMAWHARHAHPGEVALIGRIGAPTDEPYRAAWLHGYRLAADFGDAETPPAPEVGGAS